MLGGIFDFAAESLKAFNLIEGNLNRPDMIAAAVKKARQKYDDAFEKAQDTLADDNASKADKDHAFLIVQLDES